MLSFIPYLSPAAHQMIQELVAAKFHVRENVGLCAKKQVYGYTNAERDFAICTKNIRNAEVDVEQSVNETVYHESVHAAQICRGYNPIGIPLARMNLSKAKKEFLADSLRVVQNSAKSKFYKVEYEAYWLEDKPKLVDGYLRRLCFGKK